MKTITVKVSELTCAALDWAVARCEPNMLDLYYSDDNEPLILEEAPDYHQVWEPSTNWSQGGPIIEREGISLCYAEDNPKGMEWFAYTTIQSPDDDVIFAATPLVAAMRCYVAFKLGDTVEVPDEI